jgi:hypothetical protein
MKMPDNPLIAFDSAAIYMKKDVLEIRIEGKVLVETKGKGVADRYVERAPQLQMSNVIHLGLRGKIAGLNIKSSVIPTK